MRKFVSLRLPILAVFDRQITPFCEFPTIICYFCKTMDILTANALLLHEFSNRDGFKFLTHDIRSEGVDYVDYVYRAEKTFLGRTYDHAIDRDLFNLVRGFIFGPTWIDLEGRTRTGFCASEDWVAYNKHTDNHPMNHQLFGEDVDAFRRSIRFRDGQLKKFFKSLDDRYPRLNITPDRDITGADFYADVRRIETGIAEIIGMMDGLAREYPNIHVGFDDYEENGLSVAKITITQEGSFPPERSIDRIRSRFSTGGGDLASIAHVFEGCCRWSVLSSSWGMEDSSKTVKWKILPTSSVSEVETFDSTCRGFTHEIEIPYLL